MLHFGTSRNFWSRKRYCSTFKIALNSSTNIKQNAQYIASHDIGWFTNELGIGKFTINESGTIILLCRGTWSDGYKGSIAMNFDGSEIFNWNIDTTAGSDCLYKTFYKSYPVTAGNHEFIAVNNIIEYTQDHRMFTGGCSCFLIFIPD